MSIKLKYKEYEYKCNTIIWDRDSFFIDFNIYWSRLVGLIAQKIAENTTANWNNFNLVRTKIIKILGINPESDTCEFSAPINILPINIFPALLISGLKDLIVEKKFDAFTTNELFQDLVEKALLESSSYFKSSIIMSNLSTVKELNKKIKQVLITNDSKKNNDLLYGKSYFDQTFTQTNKEQLEELINNDSVFITKNLYLKKYYTKRNIENVLVVDHLAKLIFEELLEDLITIHIDGASRGNPGPSAIGIVFYKSKSKEPQEQFSEFIGNQTNNFAEYTALIRALERSLDRSYKNIKVNSDSELVVNQINKVYKVKDAYIKELYDKASSLIEKIPTFKISYIPREENLLADKLANNALKQQLH